MSLSTEKASFTQNLADEFDLFFIRDTLPNKYFVDFLKPDGTNKTYEEIRSEVSSKNRQFSETISNLIYNFIKSGDVIFTPNEVIGTCPPGGGPLAAGSATGGEII